MPRPYEADSKGLNEVARSPAVRAALRFVAGKAKAIAEAKSAAFTDTGEYASHFKIEEGTIDYSGEYPGRRAAAFLVNDVPYAAAVEWGNSRDHDGHHVLGETLTELDHKPRKFTR